MSRQPKRVAITGGAGQIAYQFLFRLASGAIWGKEHPLILQILDLPECLPLLEGVKMELEDCAFPLLQAVEITSDPYRAFADVDVACLIGAKPRSAGMERKDLLQENGSIFVSQGKALNAVASAEAHVFVVGNPCNTNCLIALSHAPRLHRSRFYAMTRLDQNRATALIAQRGQVGIEKVSRVIIWGNHSSTQVPDLSHARLHDIPVNDVIQDPCWLEETFPRHVRQRGAAVIGKRGKSSAGSAAHALIDAIRDVYGFHPKNSWFSSGIYSENNGYGVAEDLIFSFPCQAIRPEEVAIVAGLPLSLALSQQLAATERELLEERDLVREWIRH